LALPEDKRLNLVTGDIADRETVGRLIGPGTDAVFHLAAIVSGEAEANTDLGYRVNLDGTRAVLDACRALGTAPRLIFASSLAVLTNNAWMVGLAYLLLGFTISAAAPAAFLVVGIGSHHESVGVFRPATF
jgi:nucleoside-diphosphate-sugar epimerase